jgi:hypothetical protein
MKALLICPSFRFALQQLSSDGPIVTVPILGECLVTHWIEHLAGLGARHIRILAAEGLAEIREKVGDGARWGVELEVTAVREEPTVAQATATHRPAGEAGWLAEPHAIVFMDHLPGRPDLPMLSSHAGWFAALTGWLPHALTPSRMRVSQPRPGIWIGRRAHISATAQLIAPCWIGDQVFIEPGAIVGPGVIVEDRSVIESEARVTQSWVGPDTFVGPMTSVMSSFAWGQNLTNWRTDSSLRVPDPFLLCSLAPPSLAPVVEPSARTAPASSRAANHPLKWISALAAPVIRTSASTPPV